MILVAIAAGYVASGAVFGIYFAARGVSRLDKAAVGAPLVFRLLVIPGAVALWPVLLTKLVRSRGGAV